MSNVGIGVESSMRIEMSRFKNWKKPEFDADGFAYKPEWKYKQGLVKHYYGWRCQHNENLKLGMNVDIGCFSYLNAKHGIEIGDNVQLGSHCSVYSENTENETQGKVIIGKGSLIGSHCLILPNAIIKPYSKIRAFSIVQE